MASRSPALLRTAPWTRAPLLALREPAVAAVIGAVAFVIGLVAASGPLFDASTGSAALTLEMGQQCQTLTGPLATGAGPLQGVPEANASLLALSTRALARAGAPAGALGAPLVTLNTQVSVGTSTADLAPAQLATIAGGLMHIHRLAGTGAAGVWIPDDLARELGVRPGDHIVIGGSDDGPATAAHARVRVAGVYRALVGTTLPPFWCGLKAVFGTPDENFPPPPVLLTTGAGFASVLHASGIATVGLYQWERTPAAIDLHHAHALAAAVGAFRRDVGTTVSRFGPPADRLPGGIGVVDAAPDQYDFLVSHADAVQAAVSQGVIPEIVAGIVVGLLLLGSAGVFWVHRRRTEIAFLLSRGVPPGSLGLKAMLEASPLMVLGGAAGWAGSVVVLSLVGPSDDFGPSALGRSAVVTLAATVVALALLGVIAAAVSATGQRPRHALPRFVRSVPFELLGIAAALWLWASLGTVSLDAGGTSAPAVPKGFIVMPLLLLLSTSILFARLVSVALHRCASLRLGRRRTLAAWLALRRLSAAPGLAVLMVASVALAVGTFTFAGGVARSQEYTLTAKASTFVGSSTALTTADPIRLPAALAGSSTEVLSETSSTVGSAPVDTLGVSPASFARGAFWDSSYSDQSLNSLLDQLAAAPSSRSTVPVIVAGPPTLSLAPGLVFPYGTSTGPVHLRVIARTSTFPGQNGQSPLIVMTRSNLARLDQAALDEVWTKAPESAAISDLSNAGIGYQYVLAAQSELDQIEFAPVQWTFEALQALGVLIGVLSFAGLALFLTARARARSLAYALGLRMGVTRTTHLASLFVEVGLLFGTSLLIGMVIAWCTTALVNGSLNPIPDLPPGPLLVVPWTAILTALVAALIAWASSSLWAQHVTESRSAAGVLRYDID